MSVSADIGEEVRRFKKCYGLFVKERIAVNDPLMAQVKSGAKSGTEACLEIFDKGSLGSNNEINKGSDGKFDYEGMRVLKTFTELHRSFFEVPNYNIYLESQEKQTIDVIDMNEATYHYTYSMFKPGEKFSNTITRDYSFTALRYSLMPNRTRKIASITELFSFKTLDPNSINTANYVDWSPRVAQTGILIGIEPDLTPNPFPTTPGSTVAYAGRNVNQHFGAGAIGTQAYLMGNVWNFAFNESLRFQDGAGKSYRRWSKHVMSDVLCRELPALRTIDVISEVSPTSTLSYRQGISCMGCHSSMDPMTGALRNVTATVSNHVNLGNAVRFFVHRQPDMTAAPYPSMAADTSFHRRPPEGRLYYRSYDGSLVKQNVVGMDEMGEAIANTNDFYVCSAKKYYKFLTGIDVDLSDEGDINSPTLTTGEKMYRNRVIDLGLQLKQHQTIRTLFKKVIESPAFIYPDRGV